MVEFNRKTTKNTPPASQRPEATFGSDFDGVVDSRISSSLTISKQIKRLSKAHRWAFGACGASFILTYILTIDTETRR